MKRFSYVIVLLLIVLFLGGCKDKVNKDSVLYKAKENMVNNLDNYSMSANIALVNITDAKVTVNCKEDIKNEISYCVSSVAGGVGAEEYVDRKNQYMYTRMYDNVGVTTNNDWVKTKYEVQDVDQWLKLNDYIFDLKESSVANGTKYSGVISLKKVFGLLEKFDLPLDFANFMDKDVDIYAIVNNENYIEEMNMSFEVLGVKMVVALNYYDYNKTGNVEIPDDVLNVKEN